MIHGICSRIASLQLRLAPTRVDDKNLTEGKFSRQYELLPSSHVPISGSGSGLLDYLGTRIRLGNRILVLVLIFALGIIGGAGFITPRFLIFFV